MRCDSKLTQFLTHKARVHDDYADVIIMQERNLIFKEKFCVRLTQIIIFFLSTLELRKKSHSRSLPVYVYAEVS